MIFHKLDEILKVADTIIVLRDGEHIVVNKPRDLYLINAMISRIGVKTQSPKTPWYPFPVKTGKK